MLVDLALAPSISLGPEFRQGALLQWRLSAHFSLFTYPFFLIKLRKKCAFQLGDTS